MLILPKNMIKREYLPSTDSCLVLLHDLIRTIVEDHSEDYRENTKEFEIKEYLLKIIEEVPE